MPRALDVNAPDRSPAGDANAAHSKARSASETPPPSRWLIARVETLRATRDAVVRARLAHSRVPATRAGNAAKTRDAQTDVLPGKSAAPFAFEDSVTH